MDLLSRPHARRFVLASTLGKLLACVPDMDTDESTVDAPRVLAVIAEPAEARPEDTVSYSALVVDGHGVRQQDTLAWFYCDARKPLSELGPVSQDCLISDSGHLLGIGGGLAATGTVPSESCSLFGPNLPPEEEGQDPGRPVDPDSSGGYKQPIVLAFNAGAGDELVVFEQRVQCDLPGVTPQLLAEYKLRYHANQNPRIHALEVRRANGERLSLESGQPLTATPDEVIELLAEWPTCPDTDTCQDGLCGPDETRVTCAADCAVSPAPGCEGQERYLYFDITSQQLTVRRESLRFAWYSTSGKLDEERTGVGEESAESSSNVWTAPSVVGPVTLWLVVRDARGGVGSFELPVMVQTD